MRSKELLCVLQVLSAADVKMQKAILNACNDEVITFIGEIVLNLLNETIPLSPHFKSKLRDHASFIRSIGSKRVKVQGRRRLCVKHSDIVGSLLRAVSSELEELLTKT